jgi:2-polyprenyl-3-methyl-5-hydroxy-6-metoxy-1,4-benzoquinol methylase
MQKFLKKINSNFRNMSPEEYVGRLERSGKAGRKVLDAADKNDFEGVTAPSMRALYRAKNINPSISYLVTGFCNWEIYRAVITCLSASLLSDQPKNVLELGCDSGMLTLCMADQSPDSKFFGIDRESTAIDVAKKINRKYSQHQVDFHKVDLTAPGSCEALPKFDLIVAPFFFHEIISFGQNSKFLASNLKHLSTSNTQLVSFDRFPYPEQQLPNLDRLLGESGFLRVGTERIETSLESFPVSFFLTA